MHRPLLVFILLLLVLIPLNIALSEFPIVNTSYGAIRGYKYRAKNGFTGEIFKKLPYASPPVEELRWQKPEPPKPWDYIVDGTFFGPASAQHTSFWEGGVTGFSEDCLNLNIYTSRKCRESNSSCPVVYYIHGGFALFDGTMMFPDEESIRNFATQGIILVTVDYRLGVFGVMALGDENVLPANLALHDCLAGLRFIRDEIHNFGGDRNQITVMGHSTGATIALLFAFSPGINKPNEAAPFARIIAMSGCMNLESEESQVDRSRTVARALGCDGSAQELLKCMRKLNTSEILNSAFTIGGKNVLSSTQINNIAMAGELVPIKNVKELRTNQKKVKLMLGTTLVEFGTGNSPKGDGNNVNKILGVENDEECYEQYLKDRKSGKFKPDYTTQSQAIYMTNWLFANAQAKAGGEVYLYQYDYPAHALHTDDIFYLLGFHEHEKDFNEQWLSRIYPVYFANFIKGLQLAPDWEQVNPMIMNYYSVNKSFVDEVSPQPVLGYHHDIAEYYTNIMKMDESILKMNRKILNRPVEYKNLTIPEENSSSFNLRDFLFYFAVFIFVLYVGHKLFQCYQSRKLERNAEYEPLLE